MERRARILICVFRILLSSLFLICSLSQVGTIAAWAAEGAAAAPQDEQLPLLLQPDSPEYRTPRAGDGFRTQVFGREITVQPTDRRSVSAWDFGLALDLPTPGGRALTPFGSIYLWRHPNDQTLFRADLVGVYDDVFFARSSPDLKSFEWVLTFDNYTLPFAQSELVDGEAVKTEELYWGYVRPGFGFGYRRQVSPGHQDNMAAVDLTIEPGFLYFDKGSKTADNFVVPDNSFELREHLQLRWDAFERNILSLPHEGFAAGADLIYGNRFDWQNWGTNGSQAASEGRDYFSFTGYLLAAGGVPGIQSDRDRLIGSLHGGVGYHLDRFSAPRVGGGVQPMGEEYGSTWRPILPGSVIQEFFPEHYLIAAGEYRRELFFFTYLSLNGSIGWLDRLTHTGNGIEISTKNDLFSSLGARVTTGFFFNTRMQLAYNYNFGVFRDGSYGGHEVLLHFSRDF
ncbi:MAG TPA: hypothetical protein DCP92_08465 [Nitrospiraceae bacterium]|nr:hypothetical protein [Nitrospiraceae bacterium]